MKFKGSILATGFPFKQPKLMPAQFAMMNALIEDAADFRRTGSAALIYAMWRQTVLMVILKWA